MSYYRILRIIVDTETSPVWAHDVSGRVGEVVPKPDNCDEKPGHIWLRGFHPEGPGSITHFYSEELAPASREEFEAQAVLDAIERD